MKTLLSLCLSFLLIFQVQAADNRFDTIVVFGDSLSDNGNLYRYLWHIVPSSPPYYEGHFSNGPVWAEYLGNSYFPKNTAALQDYAVGGAGAILAPKENMPFTLTAEVNDYLYLRSSGKKDSTLFAIWVGGNNYMNAPTNVDGLTTNVVSAIGESIERLIAKGGNKFLIANLPDLAKMPTAKYSSNQALLTDLTLAHNQKLAATVEALKQKYPTVTIVYFDAYTFFGDAIVHAADFGFNQLDEPCYAGGYSGLLQSAEPNDSQLYTYLKKRAPEMTEQQWLMIKNNPDLRETVSASYLYTSLPSLKIAYPTQCEQYVFWDKVHPTTAIHKMIAAQVKIELDAAGLTATTPIKF